MKRLGRLWRGALWACCLLSCGEPKRHRAVTQPADAAAAEPLVASAPALASSAPPLASTAGVTRPAPATEPRIHVRKVGTYGTLDVPGSWASFCQVHRACKAQLQPVKPCEKGTVARSWEALARNASDLEGQVVTVSGRLEFGSGYFSTAVGCAKGVCCNGVSKQVVLDEEPNALVLDGLGCSGDESRLCCAVVPEGQRVIVRGWLVHGFPAPSGSWKLAQLKVCTPAE